MEKNILTVLVAFTLLVGIVNAYQNFSIRNDLSAITGNAIANVPQNNNLPQPNAQVSTDDDAVLGSATAPITIIEFSDYQCPFCGRFYNDAFKKINEQYIKTGKAKLVYRDFPLEFHQFAQKAAEASECAHEQGKFWEYNEKLFENQQSLDIDSLKRYAQDLSLDSGKFNSCLDSGKMANEVKKDANDGAKAGVSGTPTFFVNGVQLVGAQPFEAFEQIITQQLNK